MISDEKLEIVRSNEEIIAEFELVVDRLDKALDRVKVMEKEGYSQGMIDDMRMLCQRLGAKKEVYSWLMVA